MKNKLEIVINLILLAIFDSVLLYSVYAGIKHGFDAVIALHVLGILAVGLMLVKDTYKLLKPEIKSFTTPEVEEVDYEL